ncbi:exonuclease 1-like isoform X2 [Haliotis rubra]|uniref:exonuclease 1-like isoform X2 n=1 Tax=Haliotis rubra TaxID=36100 RepID=UPI001EE5173A|nr:exonuclease 1-like isoform X2 [Haliotis rubra]
MHTVGFIKVHFHVLTNWHLVKPLTSTYVRYCMKYVNNMLKKKIRPILVFDGCRLPSKKDVENTRRERREMNRKKAAAFLREGKRSEAKECLQRSVDVTPQMALQLMNACREQGVDCIVAPYEADAQLAYLNKIGVAQIVVTEDSDLLLFGCDKVIFKMDVFGNGILVEQSRLNEVLKIRSDFYTFDKFRYMCILSGCDYLASLPGIGLAKANKVFRMARQADLKVVSILITTKVQNCHQQVHKACENKILEIASMFWLLSSIMKWEGDIEMVGVCTLSVHLPISREYLKLFNNIV